MSKLDQNFANSVRENVNALILEVERLEGIIERIAKTIDPHASEGGDVEWLVKNYVENVKATGKTCTEESMGK